MGPPTEAFLLATGVLLWLLAVGALVLGLSTACTILAIAAWIPVAGAMYLKDRRHRRHG